MKLPHTIVLILILAVSNWAGTTFAEFPGDSLYQGERAKPQLNTPEKKQYRTQIIEAVKSNSVFNGHFVIAEWGCGSNCLELAIVDIQNGEVLMLRHSMPNCVIPMEGADGKLHWVDYRADSHAFYISRCGLDVAEGCAEDEYQRNLFVLEDHKLRYVHSECILAQSDKK